MPNENNKADSKDQLEICSTCSGKGTILLAVNDGPNIDTDNVIELHCPVCLGRGKTRRRSRPVRMRFRLRQKKIRPGRRKPGRRGRLSRSPIILPLPGTPLSGWPEGSVIPQSNPESECIGPYIDQPTTIDDYVDLLSQYPGETVLRMSDDIIVTIAGGLTPDLVMDTNFAQTNFQKPLEIGSGPITAGISYDLGSQEHIEAFLDLVQPHLDLPVEQLADVLGGPGKGSILHTEAPGIELSGYDSGLSADITNDPLNEVTMQPHEHMSAIHTSVLPPGLHSQTNLLDIVGFSDPIGFEVNTDVMGQVGF